MYHRQNKILKKVTKQIFCFNYLYIQFYAKTFIFLISMETIYNYIHPKIKQTKNLVISHRPIGLLSTLE